jgi:hypothetical protein
LYVFISDPKLKMHAVVLLKKHEINKESNSVHSRQEFSARKEDVSTSNNSSTTQENTKLNLVESFSFAKMLSSCLSPTRHTASDDVSKFHPDSSVAKLSTHILQQQLSSHLTSENTDRSPGSQSEKSAVHELSQLSKPLEGRPVFFVPHLHVLLSTRPLLALSVDPVSTEKCPEVESSQQGKNTEECRCVTQSLHKSPLLIKEQDINNLTEHRRALWSWDKNINNRHCWKDVTSICNEVDSLNDSVSYTSQKVKLMGTNKLLKQTPVSEGANVNSDSDGEVLQQVMTLLTVPKRTVTTQVCLLDDVLQGTEHVAIENETENRYVDLVSAIQRIMLRVSQNENTA